MITSIGNISVYVTDQDKALAFYTTKLGFEVRRDSRFGPGFRWLAVAPVGGQTEIILITGFADHDQTRIGRFTGIVLETNDIQGTCRELAERGVELTETPTQQPWGGWQAQFVDQDRNGYVLVQR